MVWIALVQKLKVDHFALVKLPSGQWQKLALREGGAWHLYRWLCLMFT